MASDSPSFWIEALGCKVNSYEISAIASALLAKGYQKSPSLEAADVIILNTCSVTATADQKSRQKISRLRRLNPNAILCLMGCYTQKHAEEAISLGGDIVLGTGKRSLLIPSLEGFKKGDAPLSLIEQDVFHQAYDELGITSHAEGTRAFLKVQDGCSNRCSYCLIPKVRGNSRSRDPRMVVEEAKSLVDKGYKEIVITGISTGSYGRDLGDGSFRLSHLLESILQACPGLRRLRISSIEESEIDDDFISLLGKYPQICDHLHLPIQSGSPDVLRAMKRRYNVEAFLRKVEAIRAIRPEIAITTDAVSGFPTETEENHRETLELFERIGFAEIHVFPFSSRPLTEASELKQLPPEVKKRRAHELLSLSASLRARYKKRFYGRKVEVLVETYDPEGKVATGHTDNYLLLRFPCQEDVRGEMVEVTYSPSVASD